MVISSYCKMNKTIYILFLLRNTIWKSNAFLNDHDIIKDVKSSVKETSPVSKKSTGFANDPKYRNLRTPGTHLHEAALDLEVVEEISDLSLTEKLSSSPKRNIESRLFPLYAVLILDSICSGIVLPTLPFYALGLGANAFQLSLVISSNYIVQTIGCTIVGGISDRFGRRPIVLACLLGSIVSNLIISRSKNLSEISVGRMIGGVMGGIIPIAQSYVADTVSVNIRPKFIGRLQACIGIGFVLGSLVMMLVNKIFKRSTQLAFFVASIFPTIGLFLAFFFLHESKVQTSSKRNLEILLNVRNKEVHSSSKSVANPLEYQSLSIKSTNKKLNLMHVFPMFQVPYEVALLASNGFLIVYAFSIETIYAIFLKDNFNMGHLALSTVFAVNGVLIGMLQLFCMRPLVSYFGKHMLLIIGNLLLALGMLGLSLIRTPALHFFLVSVHIVGYSVADTSLVSLISRYAGETAQGRSLGLNQAAQSTARVISPLIAGYLYTNSNKIAGNLPAGALPYIVGSVMPLLAISSPVVLYLRNKERKSMLSQKLSKTN